MNVLLIDDEEDLLTILSSFLERPKIIIETASTVEEALKKIKNDQLIFLDIPKTGIHKILDKAQSYDNNHLYIHSARTKMELNIKESKYRGFIEKPDSMEIISKIVDVYYANEILKEAV